MGRNRANFRFAPTSYAILAAVLACGIGADVQAGDPPCGIWRGSSFEIISISDAFGLVARTGEVIRPLGLDFPSPLRHGDRPAIAGLRDRALAELRRAIGGRMIRLSAASPLKPDRYGHLVAQIHLEKDGSWLQSGLLRGGLARLRPQPGEVDCVNKLFKDELYARQKSLGLWALPEFRQGDAQDQALKRRSGGFRLVGGTIKSVGKTKRRVYLNFGEDWATDFTAAMTTKVFKTLQARGMTKQHLTGKRVLVRGWLEIRRGPYIEVFVAEQIELAE